MGQHTDNTASLNSAAVAELIEAAPKLSDYLDGYLQWQREQGNDPVGLDIAETDIAVFRAALARCRGGES